MHCQASGGIVASRTSGWSSKFSSTGTSSAAGTRTPDTSSAAGTRTPGTSSAAGTRTRSTEPRKGGAFGRLPMGSAGCVALTLGLALSKAKLGLMQRVVPVWVGDRCTGGGVSGGAGTRRGDGGAWRGIGGAPGKCLSLFWLGGCPGGSIGTTLGGCLGGVSSCLIGGVRLLLFCCTGDDAIGTPEERRRQIAIIGASESALRCAFLSFLYSWAQAATPRRATIERMIRRSRSSAR